MLNDNRGVQKIISNLSLVISFCFFAIGFLISFISLIVFKKYDYSKNWHWWIIINGIASAVIVFIIISKDIAHGYRFALMTYLGICMNWTIQIVNELIHSQKSSGTAVGVGQLLISVAYFIWILYFGCDNETSVGRFINSNGTLRNSQDDKNPNNTYNLQNVTTDSSVQRDQSISVNNQPTVIRAEALFDYTANKDDPNEISFNQGEIMEILDNNGRWWQARKADGTMGIVPSNFFKVI